MLNTNHQPLHVYPVLVLMGALIMLTFMSCSSLTSQNTEPNIIETKGYSMIPVAMTPTIEFQYQIAGETSVVVKGLVNVSDPTLKVYAGPGSHFPIIGELDNKAVINIMGKNKGWLYRWLYISYSNSGSEITGWVPAKYILVEEDDLHKIGIVQVVTPTALPYLP